MKETIISSGKEVGSLVQKEKTVSYLTDTLTGILNSKTSDDEREEALKTKYELAE